MFAIYALQNKISQRLHLVIARIVATVSDYAKLSDRYHDRLAYCVITDERMLVLADVCWQNKTPPLVDGVSIASELVLG